MAKQFRLSVCTVIAKACSSSRECALACHSRLQVRPDDGSVQRTTCQAKLLGSLCCKQSSKSTSAGAELISSRMRTMFLPGSCHGLPATDQVTHRWQQQSHSITV